MKNHYERLICLCCFLLFFVNIGLPSTSFSVFMPYLAALPDVGNTGSSLIISFRTLVSLTCLLFVNRFVDRLGARKAATAASAMTGVGFFLYSLADTLLEFFAGAVLLGAGNGLGGTVIVALVTRRWFATGVGTAVGIATMGSGISSLVLPPIAARIVEGTSLAWGFRFEGALALLFAAIIFALLRDDPAQMGREPYRSNKPQSKASEHTPATKPLPKVAMAALFVGTVLLGGGAIDGTNYFSLLLTSQGISPLHAASVVSALGFALTFGKFISGFVVDRIGTLRGSLVLYGTMLAGLVLACFSGANQVFPFAAAILFGFGITLGSVGISLWSMELASPETLTTTVKNVQVAYSLGGFLFSLVPGPLMDLCGSYLVSYVIFTAITVVSLVIIFTLYRRFRPDL